MTPPPPIDRAQLVATRRDLHQHPELGFEERRTSALVAERLERLGYAVRTGVGKTGVVGLSVTQLHAGHAFNVTPGRADLRGTVRTFGGKFYDEAPSLVEETARGIARAFGGDAEVRYRRLSKPLVNDQKMTPLMKGVAQDVVWRERVIDGVRTMGGEDMAFFLARVPGAFAFVGSAPPDKKGSPHHSPTFDLDEESLVIGAELVSRTVVRYLEQGS